MKKLLKTIAVGFIIGAIFINVFLSRENYMASTNIIRSQAMILQLQAYFNEINVKRNMLLEEKLDKVQLKEVKPSFEYLQSVTVRLTTEFMRNGKKMVATGTGSIIKVTEDFTYILTNRHVALMDSKNLLVIKDGKKYKGMVLKNGITRDLSLVRITGKIPNTSVVKGFAKTKEQNKIYSVGMYSGFQDIYTQGTVAGWTPNGSRLINMPSLYGCSGSGIFDKDGNMVAILYAGTSYNFFGLDTAKAWCVPYIAIMTFLEEIL